MLVGTRKINLRCRHIHSASTDLPQVFHIVLRHGPTGAGLTRRDADTTLDH
jgi:hypothetical protein